MQQLQNTHPLAGTLHDWQIRSLNCNKTLYLKSGVWGPGPAMIDSLIALTAGRRSSKNTRMQAGILILSLNRKHCLWLCIAASHLLHSYLLLPTAHTASQQWKVSGKLASFWIPELDRSLLHLMNLCFQRRDRRLISWFPLLLRLFWPRLAAS
jgi:hypothetical protein